MLGVPATISAIAWGEKNPLAGCSSVNDYYFTAFHLTACGGMELFGNLTSNYLASIDTINPCLLLAAPIFEAVRLFFLSTERKKRC